MNTTEAFFMTETSTICGTVTKPVEPKILASTAIQGLIAGTGLLGNAIVIFVLILARDRQDTSSIIYVLNLALADFFFLATVPFKIHEEIMRQWTAGEFMCRFAGGFLIYLNFFASPLFLMVMSIDRYLAVNKAVSSAKLRALKSSRLVSIAVWVVAVVAVLPPTAFHSTYPEELYCKPRFPGSKSIVINHDFCEFRKRFYECTHEFITNHTMEISTGPSLPDSGTQAARFRREIEETTRTTKKRKGSRKDNGKKKNRKNRRKKKEKTDSNNDMTSLVRTQHPTQALDSLILMDPPDKEPDMFENPSTESPPDVTRVFDITKMLTSERSKNPVSPTETTLDTTQSGFTNKAGNLSLEISEELKQAATLACMVDFLPEDNQVYEKGKCFHEGPVSFRVWVVLNFVYSYFIPCGVIVICYLAILRKLYKPSKIVHSHTRGHSRRQAVRKKVTLMVAMLVLSYLICFTPYYIWQVMLVPGISVSSTQVCHDMRKFIITMCYVNSAVNPLLYTFLSDQFGSKFRLAWARVVRKTEYHFGTVRSIRRKKSSSAMRKNANRGTGADGVNRGDPVPDKVEEDQRHLMEANNEEERSNNAQKVVVAEIERENGKPSKESGLANNAASAGSAGFHSSSQKPKESIKAPAADDVSKKARKTNQNVKMKRCSSHKSRSSSASHIFPCIKDCSSDSERECPHCAVEMGNIKSDDVVESDDDVLNKDVINKLNDEPRNINRGEKCVNDFTGEENPEQICLAGKLCKKHKKSMREIARKKDDVLSPGRWRSTSSLRSDTKFQTEMSAVVTNM